VYETVGSVDLALLARGGPVGTPDQPRGVPGLHVHAAAEPDPDLAWQSSIGQFIFLQSLAQQRI
jgi:hypothetical protein